MSQSVKESGFSLVEVVIALALFSFGVVAAASGLVAVTRLASEGRALTQAATLAASRLGGIRHEGCEAAGEEVLDRYVVAWGGIPVPGGRLITITVRRPVPGGWSVDSLSSFQRCDS